MLLALVSRSLTINISANRMHFSTTSISDWPSLSRSTLKLCGDCERRWHMMACKLLSMKSFPSVVEMYSFAVSNALYISPFRTE